MLESAADSQQFASAERAASDTTMYQVNIHTNMDDEETFDIVTYAEGGYKGATRGTTSSDGSYEQTEWCAFVGTLEECQSFVAERDKWCVVPSIQMYGRKYCDILKATAARVVDAIFVGSEKECKAEAERYIAENMRPMDYISDVKTRAFKSEDEAMHAISKMLSYLGAMGNEIHVRPYVDVDIETGLRGLGVEVCEVWYPTEPDNEGTEYANRYSIGIEGSGWNIKDITIIRGIQAAAYLTYKQVSDKALRRKSCLELVNNKVYGSPREVCDIVSCYCKPETTLESGAVTYMTYSTIKEFCRMNIIDIIDVLEKNGLLKNIVLK